MFITRRHISRRTALRGMGVTMALPFMEAMVPALTPLREDGGGLANTSDGDRDGARLRRAAPAKARASTTGRLRPRAAISR